MTEESTQVEASSPRQRGAKRRWLRPATGSSAYRTETDGQQTSTSLSVIVPAYNEQYLVEASLERLKILETSPLLHRVQVVVVNDGSKDSTAEAIARFRNSLEPDRPDSKLQWIWLQHDRNQGKGAAIRTALAHAECELVVIHDADLEYHPWDLLQMIELFLYEDADAVFGSRFMSGGHKRALFFRHALGNKFLTFLCDLVSDLNLTDMETCYKMVRADLLKSIPLESSTFDVEPELAIKLAKRGARVFEVPISYSGRTYREGKKIGWRDGVRALWAILHYGASSRIYTDDAQGGEILERINHAPRFNKWMADVVRPHVGDRVLEIGAGIGNMSVNLMPRSSLLGHGRKSGVFELPRIASSHSALHECGLHRRRERRLFSQGSEFRHGCLPECHRASPRRRRRFAERLQKSGRRWNSDHLGSLRSETLRQLG